MATYPIASLGAKITLDDTQFRQVVNSSKSALASLYKVMTGIAIADWGFDKIKDGLSHVALTAIDLESRFANLRKTTGLSEEGLGKLGGKLSELSFVMAGIKFNDLIDIGTMAGRLGIGGDKVDEFSKKLEKLGLPLNKLKDQGEQIADFARDVGMLAVALDDMKPEDIANSFSRLLTVFHLSTDAAIRMGSALNKLDDSSNASGAQILDVTRRLSGAASTLGLTVQKTMALSTTLIEAGIDAEVAGTAFSQVFAKMATAPEKFAMVAGVSVQKFTQYLRKDPILAVQAFMAGLGKLDKITQFQALDQLGLKGARVGMSVLQLNRAIKNLPEHIRTANSEFRTLSSIENENEIKSKTLGSQITVMQNHIQAMSGAIGKNLLPVMGFLTRVVGRLADQVGGMFTAAAPQVQRLSAWLMNAGRHMALLVTEFATFRQIWEEWKLEKIERFWAILARIGADFQTMMNKIDQVLQTNIERVLEDIQKSMTQVGEDLRKNFNFIAVDLEHNFRVGFDNAFIFMKNWMAAVVKMFKNVFTNMGEFCAVAFTKAFAATLPLDTLEKMGDMIGGKIGERIKGAISPFKFARDQVQPPLLDMSGFNKPELEKDTKPLPGFGAPPGMRPLPFRRLDRFNLPGFRDPFKNLEKPEKEGPWANLPDHQPKIDKLWKELLVKSKVQEADDERRRLRQMPSVQNIGKALAQGKPRVDFKNVLNRLNAQKGLPQFRGGNLQAKRILETREKHDLHVKKIKAQVEAHRRKPFSAVHAANRAQGERVASNLGMGGAARKFVGNMAAQAHAIGPRGGPNGQRAIETLAGAAGQGAQQIARIVSLAQSIMKKIEDNNKRIGQLEGQGRNQAKRNR